MTAPSTKKIIHLDMDMFFVAVEIRDNPSLKNKPVAIGGPKNSRGVLSTANYVARKYGVRSAMPSNQALKLCPDLILLPGNMSKYYEVSKEIFKIFREYSDKVEGLSLDEAYIDVSKSPLHNGSATLIAKEIKERVFKKVNLTVSAGVAPNKLLAKLASDVNKPDGITAVHPTKVMEFISAMPVARLFGIGKVSQEKLKKHGIINCADLQKKTKIELALIMGSFGETLYNYCRGIDHREVLSERARKSVSVERTFAEDLMDRELLTEKLSDLKVEFKKRWEDWAKKNTHKAFIIKSVKVKIKTFDFQTRSVEEQTESIEFDLFDQLFEKILSKFNVPIRLLGIGVRIEPVHKDTIQLDLFDQNKHGSFHNLTS